MKMLLAGWKGSRVAAKISKMLNNILHPLRDMPVPDFNNQYDSTML